MPYHVHEIYPSKQGEGMHSGTPCVFCRFRGCNLWSGVEKDRQRAICRWCDTQFVGAYGPRGGTFASSESLARTLLDCWHHHPYRPQTAHTPNARPFIILTGGEPSLQLDAALIHSLHKHHCHIAIETNGTRPITLPIDWICVSPKAHTTIAQKKGHELKVVMPQHTITRHTLSMMAQWDFQHFFIQPLDAPAQTRHIAHAMALCATQPPWRLSVQSHKWQHIP
ncbi:MAG: 7-carboxy-7-deazaguanine synthase [Alphaproteobacteria bacterium GM7ARS4]|nr:7-carboxy-7-deazaguanine synthase [Alphaproteobacteria bacterium GM7ARS4]